MKLQKVNSEEVDPELNPKLSPMNKVNIDTDQTVLDGSADDLAVETDE